MTILLFTNLDKNSITANQKEYARHPPIAQNFWIQKDLKAPEKTILMVEFKSDYPMPYLLRMNFLGKKIRLQDTGRYPDAKRNDGIYTTQIDVNPNLLARDLSIKYKQTAKKGYYVKYKGHTAYTTKVERDFAFDIANFNRHIPVNIIPDITNVECNSNLQKQKSLFITDLSVVEDDARTYKLVTYDADNKPITINHVDNYGLTTQEIPTAGTPLGEWTFGNLMQNMAGGPLAPGEDPARIKDFLKEWVIALYRDYQINGEHSLNDITGETQSQMRLSRERGVFYHLIEPWLTRAYGGTKAGNYTFANWEFNWDNVDLEQLLINAPFKLTAIVNRVDLRENMLYNNNIHSGEIRFIFTLIETITGGDKGEISLPNLVNGERHPKVMLGKPPHHINQNNVSSVSQTHLDWQGMNVILEYGIPFTKFCDLKNYMKDWYDLSLLDFNSTYLSKLETLTKAITDANVMPNQPNGSAISQVRTNDRLFHLPSNGFAQNKNWEPIKWELRQFELETNPTNGNYAYLTNAPVTNTPLKRTNTAPNTMSFITPTTDSSVTDWVFGTNGSSSHTNTIKAGNHNLPNNLLSPTAIVEDHLAQHYGFNWANVTSYTNDNEKDKELQRQISLNSCQGCHSNEVKTLFTMVRPLGYGQEAIYWGNTPSTSSGKLDLRFYQQEMVDPDLANTGKTYDEYLNASVDNFKPTSELAGGVSIPNVAAFITGRNYINGSFEDDETDPTKPDNDPDNVLNDSSIKGYFWVNNPNNQANENANINYDPASADSYPHYHNDRNEFNELERRKTHFCNLVDGSSCQTGSGVPLGGYDNTVYSFYGLIKEIAFVPLPEQSH